VKTSAAFTAFFILPLMAPAGAVLSSDAPPAVTLRDTVYHVSEILVEAERMADLEDVRSRPGFIAIVPVDDASRRVSSAAAYLARTVGFHVRSTGGYGTYSTASVRGASASQVKVFIDGVPLHQAQSGIIDLADLPTASISRIEVYRGYGPFDLSGSSIGGVVNVVTRHPGENGRGHLAASYGSLSTSRLGGSYSVSLGSWDLLGIARSLSTEGDYSFLDDNGTPYNESDDRIVKRINNRLDEVEALAKATGPVAGGMLTVTNQFYHRDQGLPGYSTVQSATEKMSKNYNLTHLAWHRFYRRGGPPGIELGAHYLLQIDRFADETPPGAGGKPDEENLTTSAGGTLRWGLPLPALRQSLRGLLSFTTESFRPRETGTRTLDGEKQRRRTIALSFEDEVFLCGSLVRLVPSARFENYTDRMQRFETVREDLSAYFRNVPEAEISRSRTTGSVGLVVKPGAGLTVKAHYGTYYRIPSLMELFGYRGVVVPNPVLRPETGVNRDAGVTWDSGPWGGPPVSAELAYFRSDVDDLIMYTYLQYARAAQAVNIESADVEGYEASLLTGPFRGFRFEGSLTRLRAINTGPVRFLNGKHLPNRPGLEAHAGLFWRGYGFSAFYEFDYVSGNYWNAYNGKAPNNKGPLFDIRRLHGIGVTAPTGLPHMLFTLEVKNLTDERVEDVMGYPLPGRSVFGTLTLNLRPSLERSN
jgi:outer membrane cobalamin receptor